MLSPLVSDESFAGEACEFRLPGHVLLHAAPSFLSVLHAFAEALAPLRNCEQGLASRNQASTVPPPPMHYW